VHAADCPFRPARRPAGKYFLTLLWPPADDAARAEAWLKLARRAGRQLSDPHRLAFPYRWATRAVCLDKTDATKLLAKIHRQWFAGPTRRGPQRRPKGASATTDVLKCWGVHARGKLVDEVSLDVSPGISELQDPRPGHPMKNL